MMYYDRLFLPETDHFLSLPVRPEMIGILFSIFILAQDYEFFSLLMIIRIWKGYIFSDNRKIFYLRCVFFPERGELSRIETVFFLQELFIAAIASFHFIQYGIADAG